MKNILAAVIFLMMFAGAANAQTRDTITPSPIPGKVMTTDASEYVYMKNGSLVLHQPKEKDAVLLETYKCDNGSTVSTTGTYTPPDGAIINLTEGDKVYKDGRYDAGKK